MVKIAWNTLIVIVFVIAILSVLALLFFSLQREAGEFTSGVFEKTEIVEAARARQANVNAFVNVVKSFEECAAADGCLCDIYMLDLAEKSGIKVENEQDGVRIKISERGEVLRSAFVQGVSMGLFGRDMKCRDRTNALISADIVGWYAWSPEFRFLEGKELFRQNGSSSLCLITSKLLKWKNATELETYFSQFPSCRFKASKEREKAIEVFTRFVEKNLECFTKNEQNCRCEIGPVDLPEGFVIKIVLDGKIRFQLFKSSNMDLGNESLVTEVKSPLIKMFLEKGLVLKAEEVQEACLLTKDYQTKAYKDCNFAAESFNIEANKSFYTIIFSKASSIALLQSPFGLLDIEVPINRNNIQFCFVAKEGEYSAGWPVGKHNSLYYVEECFGLNQGRCEKGLKVLQTEGSPVYSVDDGVVESIEESARKILIKHKNKIVSEYENVLPVLGITEGAPVKKSQQIGILIPKAEAKKSYLQFSIIDKALANMPAEYLCSDSTGKDALVVAQNGLQYHNPLCYIDPNVKSQLVFSEGCFAADCSYYGNKGETDQSKLKVLAIPLNWEESKNFIPFANNALDTFLNAVPLKNCPRRFKKLFADGKTNYGANWSNGYCLAPAKNGCYNYVLKDIKECAEQYKASTGEDYDIVIGIDDSNIAHRPGCNYAERGWTMDGSKAIIAEAQYESDIAHELGHKFGLQDQYCECEGTSMEMVCGSKALPNPLMAEEGCDALGDCCGIISNISFPYALGCRWCKGNFDINAIDTNKNSIPDKGNRTIMSNYPNLEGFGAQEYKWLGLQTKMQCV